MRHKVRFLLGFVWFFGCYFSDAQNMYPGSVGQGTQSKGAYAGDTLPEIVYVENLNSSGPGSFRNAVSNSFPRIVVFNVSGNIKLEKGLVIKHPYLFIAGQSAPGKGITISGAPVIVKTHDILVQDVRFRLGSDYPRQSDCVSITGTNRDVRNVVFDHCSFAYGLDENIGILNAGPGITISNSIIAYGLHAMEHSCGLLAMNSSGISLIGNVFASNFDRNPNIRGDTRRVEILNNLIYNSASHAVYFGSRGPKNKALHALLENNLYITGPDNMNRYLLSVHEVVPDSLSVFWNDNITLHDGKVYDRMSDQLFDNSERFQPVSQRPFESTVDSLIPASTLLSALSQTAGARPDSRDQLDSLVIETIKNTDGGIVKNEQDLNISMELPFEKRTFKLPNNPHVMEKGFSRIQIYLQDMLGK